MEEKTMEWKELIRRAESVIHPRSVSDSVEAGEVGAALLTDRGNVYLGANIDSACSVGFCAEHAAIGAMLTAGESRVVRMVAVRANAGIIPPCGRCREFLYQINRDNLSCEVALSGGRSATLAELLPERWN